MVSAIACVDENWAIGKDNELLYRIPEDMKFFKEKTMGKFVVMGRKTLESLPNPEEGLEGRINIILSRDKNLKTTDNYLVYHDISGLLSAIRLLSVFMDKDIYIIGGSEIYSQLIDICDMVYITKVHNIVPDANKFFPNLDQDDSWKRFKSTEDYGKYNNLEYEFITYTRSWLYDKNS